MGDQLAIDFAARQRDKGMVRSQLNAENLSPGWSAAAYRMLCDYASHTERFTSEDFREHLAKVGFPVEVPKALGAVFQKAARQKVIAKIGFGISRQRHLSPCPLWESSACRKAA